MMEGKVQCDSARRMFASEIVIPVVVLAALGGVALAAQDKYTVESAQWARVL